VDADGHTRASRTRFGAELDGMLGYTVCGQ
jgi:hypothetical protein